MNNEELESLNLLKLKYRRVNEIIHPFYRIGPPPRNKFSTSLISGNVKTLRDVLLNHAEDVES